MSAPSLSHVFARSERMVGRQVADEFILVPLVGKGADVDSILNLNRVGTFIWENLDGARDGASVVAKLVERFEVEPARAAEDYLGFVAKLVSVHALREVAPEHELP
ncbi:MAG TPA: PqqD family protein [Vicinamibacteria bacterium]